MSLVNFAAIALILTVIQVACFRDAFYFLRKSENEDKDILLILNWINTETELIAACDIVTGRDQIREAVKSAEIVQNITDDQLREFLDNCDTVNDPRSEEDNEILEAPKTKTTKSNSQTTTPGYDGIPIIFPGTKWCGAGDRAKNYDDLGLHQDTDRCCRAHDLCNDTLAPGETKNGLTNTSPFTKLSCQCDDDFYNCLDRVNTVISNTIGIKYFNVLRRECYTKDYPDSKKCKKYKGIIRLKCVEYEKDKTKPQVYKWVPAKKYKKLPFPGPLTVTLPDIIPF